jgi:hypothetical protein
VSPPVFCGDNGELCNDELLVDVRDNFPLFEKDDGVEFEVLKSMFSLVFRLNKIGSLGSICTIDAGTLSIFELEPFREIISGDRPSSLPPSAANEFFRDTLGDLVDDGVGASLFTDSATDFFDLTDRDDRTDLDDFVDVWVSDLANGGNLFLEGELPMSN